MGLCLTIMKTINFKHINERIEKPVTDLPANSFEYYINLTAKLIDRLRTAVEKFATVAAG